MLREFSSPGGEPGADGPPNRLLVGCGEPRPGLEVVIAEPDAPRACAPGEIGEILVSGGSVANGYWNAQEATARAFGQRVAGFTGSFLRTGDLGTVVDGQVYVTGRGKDVIVLDGVNHYPADLETTVETAEPAVRSGHCAVVSVDEGGRELVVVLAELTGRAKDGAESAVRDTVRRVLSARHGVPVHEVVLLRPGSLPFTSSGKLRRAECRAGYVAGRFDRHRVSAARAGKVGQR